MTLGCRRREDAQSRVVSFYIMFMKGCHVAAYFFACLSNCNMSLNRLNWSCPGFVFRAVVPLMARFSGRFEKDR